MSIKITYVPIEELNPATYNPRKWDKQQMTQLKESIKRHGFVDPIIVNKTKNRKNVVIGGHMRLQAAGSLGLTEVPVVYLDIPDPEKEKELNLRLNKNSGEWDLELLKELDLDLLLDVGFGDEELFSIWDASLKAEEDGFKVDQELSAIETPETQDGDLLALGPHRLICGDATKAQDLKRLVGSERLQMIYSDPPYNINFDYVRGVGNKAKYGGSKTKDHKTDEAYAQFLEASLLNALAHCDRNTHVFYWCDQKYIGLLQSLYRKYDINPLRVCLWIKNGQNPTPQVAFHKSYEPCVYGVRGKPFLSGKVDFNEIFNPEIDTGNRALDDIMDLMDIWLVKRLATSDYQHPTQKPPTLHERALKRCTKVNDIVLDSFGGSGSTLIACDQLGRRAFLVEHEPAFCDLIIKRYLALNPQYHVKKLD